MDTKEQLVEHIRNWIGVDSDISSLQKQIKELRERKKGLTENLVEVMKNNEIDCFDINNGQIIYSKSKVKKAISKKTLLEALSSYFKNDGDRAKDISEHILNSREEVVKENIRRKIIK